MRKVLLALAAVLVLAVVGAGGAVWWFLSRFDARAEIEKRVEAATGRDFALTGPVSVSFWPTIGFRGAGAALANVAGGAAPHLLEAKEIVIGVALHPLLDRRVEVSRFVLVEPTLALEVDTAGRANWILKPATPPAPPRPGAAPQVADFHLVGAEIRDGRVTYRNARTGSAYALSAMDLKASMKGLDSALDVNGSVTYRDKPLDVDVTVGKVRAAMAGQATPLTFTIDSDVLKNRFEGTVEAATGALAGDVTATGPSLRNLAAWAGSPLGAGYGLEAFALRGKLTVGAKRYAFENAGLMIDAIKARGDFVVEPGPRTLFLSGRLEIADAQFDPLAGAGAPTAQRMLVDLNPYLAPPASAAAVEVATLEPVNVAAPGWSEAKLNLGWMKAINANLEVTTGPLKVQNLAIDNAAVSLTLLDGYLSATLGRMELYGGQGSARLEVDARQPEIVVRNEIAAQNLRAKDFFRDAFGFTNLDGVAKVEWGLSSRGASQKAMMQTLSGAGSVSFANGSLAGVDLGGVARTIRSAMRRELVAPTARTPFTRLSATIRAADGVVATQDLELDAADARLTAVGVIDAANRSLDLRLVPRLGAMGVAVPFRVSGPWTGLGYASDLLGRARPTVEGKVRAVIARAPRR